MTRNYEFRKTMKRTSTHIILITAIICLPQVYTADPCDTTEHINDWQRSVAFATDTTQICDNILAEGWYRVTSDSGELMPTECPVGGLRCNTAKPIYLYTDDLPVGEEAYPAVGVTVTRTAYAANYDGNCKHTEYEIQIKNCDGYYVYFLKSITSGCTSAYCFGTQLPCENGTTSENGFSPGCDTFPDVTVTPFVKVTLTETEAVNKFEVLMVYSKATFECHANDLTDGYKYKTRWYINDIEMKDAKLEGLSKTDVEAGLGRMLEEHWTSTYKPNMIVKCAIQVGGEGFGTYGPQHNSEVFFAGLKIDPSSTTDYQVLEGEELNIPAELTMPLSCAWPKNVPQNVKDNIRQNDCILVLLNGVPDYQLNGEECINGITKDGLIFKSETCGIKFSHSNWQEKQMIKILGQTDQIVNIEDRIVLLRLYNSDEVEPIEPISYWKNIHLPDIKVYVKDADIVTLGRSCYSQNDPHMRTFDQKIYELQLHQGLTEGEYIMYKHDRLPLQVSAYFRKCSTSILCNCGVAVRSGNSLFVANYCETNYKGTRKINRYMTQRLCDDQSLTVTKSGYTYAITLPTGTKVTFNYGSTYVDGINIIPSVLDTGMTKGLCGIYNGNANDDFMPRDQLAPVTDIKTFASSWQVKGAYADETLFDPEGELKETIYNGQQYCTCVSPHDDYPHGSPDFNCELTAAMKPCRDTKTALGVYTADCATVVAARKKDQPLIKEKQFGKRDPPLIMNHLLILWFLTMSHQKQLQKNGKMAGQRHLQENTVHIILKKHRLLTFVLNMFLM
ncbi:von Willebrand factor D and EGF domain-containing protein-like [Mytilus californianus]|uniref:von Willebrand factor D and EGF domain-containing protein-like n=1 Tax=Mytilus californianus TaxID=6549 RepID=UPI0022452B6E|nr:von Willebrand factor D and EGF domain-containing protein-like [Mytilus californianus]XP_052076399.1 von Willebrand factor D and EGF domain-containing protein-like [Mytilus californianus]